MTVKCMFGSAVQEKGEAAMPEWCGTYKNCAEVRSSYDCYFRLKEHGIDPIMKEEKEERS